MAEPKRTSFLPPEPERTVSTATWLVAGGAVLLLVVIAALATLRRTPASSGAALPPDRAAASLPISGVTMSEATNGAGGKSVYIDGVLTNSSQGTLTGATAQVTFGVGEGQPPYREVVPVALVRTREPYVDLQPISASPIGPGQASDFRLIFESVPATWDVQPPAIAIVHASFR